MNVRELARIRRRTIALGAAVLCSAAILQFAAVNPAASQTSVLRAYPVDNDPGLDPAAAVWTKAAPLQLPLSAQQGAYAAGGGSVPIVTARAVHHEGRLFVRLEWDDSTMDASTARVQDFADAVALEFPARAAASVPSLCMGQADAGVNIWHWRADSQAGIKDPTELYVGALVDRTPFKEKDVVFYTARDAGNPYADPAQGPVQTLVSQAFGNLTKADVQDVKGNGVHANGRWAVVFERQLSGANGTQSTFASGASTDMAVAVWNGSDGDRNGRKSVSQFAQLQVASLAGLPESQGSGAYLLAGGTLLAFVLIGGGLAFIGYRQSDARR